MLSKQIFFLLSFVEGLGVQLGQFEINVEFYQSLNLDFGSVIVKK